MQRSHSARLLQLSPTQPARGATASRPPLVVLLMMMVVSTLMLPALSSAALAALQQSGRQDDTVAHADGKAPDVNPRWLDRLDQLDRALVDANLGYAPHAFTDDLRWINTEATSWDELRGKVVVVHTWTSGTGAGRRVPVQLHNMFSEVSSDDLQIFALHTPDNADNIDRYLEQRGVEVPALIDARGRFCDELGMYKRPTNIIVDRNGVVRFAGLRLNALTDAVAQLLSEPFDPDAKPQPRPTAQVAEPADFPAITGNVGSATDFRGRRAPDFHVERWLHPRPDAEGKLVVIDFWATWCGPCIAAIPHMNELADTFRDDVVCVGLSDESTNAFNQGMSRLARDRDITLETFRYPLALDSRGRMKNALSVRGIPHVIVMSSDWVVRWQGHPVRLTEQLLSQIVQANRALQAGNQRRYRFSR